MAADLEHAYVSAWHMAAHAAHDLREALRRCRLLDGVPHLRGDVTASGDAVVDLGRIDAETARALINLLRQVPEGDRS